MDPFPTSLGLALAALALVLGLIWLSGRIAQCLGLQSLGLQSLGLQSLGRSRGVPRTGTRLLITETLRIDPKRQLLLLRCDEREMLILTGGGPDLLVGWLPAKGQAE